jgi:hypothetical protein
MTTLVTAQTLEPTFSQTLVANQTLFNKTLKATKEIVTFVNTAPTGVINFDVATQTIMRYNTQAAGNFSLNIRGDASTNLGSLLAVGESIGLCLIVPNGSNSYYLNAITIPGSTAMGYRYQNGITLAEANPNSLNMYNLFIIKTGANSFEIFTSLTKY